MWHNKPDFGSYSDSPNLSLPATPTIMANITRSAKPAFEWTYHDLDAYNIAISAVHEATFFPNINTAPALNPLHSPIFFNSTDPKDPKNPPEVRKYLYYLRCAASEGEASTVNELLYKTLTLLDFDASDAAPVVRFDYQLPLAICGEQRSEDTGVCMLYMYMDSLPSILLVSAANGVSESARTEPRVIAKANNARRRQSAGRAPLHAMTIPCITMSGLDLCLYLVRITEDLSVAVRTGQYPSVRTVVQKFVANPPTDDVLAGMAGAAYRKRAFEYLLAFKDLAKIHWTALLA